MKTIFRTIPLTACAVIASGVGNISYAATATSNMTVSANVSGDCTIAANPLALKDRSVVRCGIMDRSRSKEDRAPLVGPPPPGFSASLDAITPSANVRVDKTAVLSASVNYSRSFPSGNSATLALVIPLGARRSVTSTGSIQDSGSTSATEYSQQLPIGTGYGYRVRATTDTTARVDGDFSYQNDRGTYDFQAEEAQEQTSWRLEERSSVIWMQKQLAISRWLNDSFALVETDGVKDIKVYANNQYVATTNSHGLAVIPNLVSYDRNTVRLDDGSAPLDLEMDLAEKTVAPMTRSGVLLKFKTSPVEGALIQLRTPDGSDVPQEAEVRVNDVSITYRSRCAEKYS